MARRSRIAGDGAVKALLLGLGPYDSLGDWVRGLLVALAAGVFLTFSGAFGTAEAPLVTRLAYWLPLMAIGYVWGAFVVGRLFRGLREWTGNVWLDAGLAALFMSIPFTFVVWL
eukprot:gene44595-59506_t